MAQQQPKEVALALSRVDKVHAPDRGAAAPAMSTAPLPTPLALVVLEEGGEVGVQRVAALRVGAIEVKPRRERSAVEARFHIMDGLTLAEYDALLARQVHCQAHHAWALRVHGEGVDAPQSLAGRNIAAVQIQLCLIHCLLCFAGLLSLLLLLKAHHLCLGTVMALIYILVEVLDRADRCTVLNVYMAAVLLQ